MTGEVEKETAKKEMDFDVTHHTFLIFIKIHTDILLLLIIERRKRRKLRETTLLKSRDEKDNKNIFLYFYNVFVILG